MVKWGMYLPFMRFTGKWNRVFWALSMSCISLFIQACGTPELVEAPSVSGDTWDDLRRACIDFTNEKRADMVIDQLERWTAAEACSDSQATADLNSDVAHGNFGKCGEMAQNTCPGWNADSTFANQKSVMLSCLQSMWEEGPGTPYSSHGHYINMSNPDYQRMTCGFSLKNGRLWINQNFQ